MWGTCDISKPTYFFPSLFSWGIPPVYRGSHPSSPQRSTNVPKKKYPPQKRGKKRGGDGVPSGNERTTAFGKFIEKSWLLRRLHVKASWGPYTMRRPCIKASSVPASIGGSQGCQECLWMSNTKILEILFDGFVANMVFFEFSRLKG